MPDVALFVVFPYVAVALAGAGTVYGFLSHRFSYAIPGSQTREDGLLYWGAVPWYLSIGPLLLIHLGGFFIPGVMAALHSTPAQLYLAELVGKMLAFLAFAGILVILLRRLTQLGIRTLTSPLDWLVLALILNQLFLGLWVALFYRWGSAWFIYTATPWVASLATFNPQPEYVSGLPWVPKLHFLNATLLIALFPFSRLVHLLTLPIAYLWRLAQGMLRNRRALRRRPA